jgi:hypothetical protein
MRQRSSTTCARCGASFDATSWGALALIDRLHHEQLRDLLTDWPWRADEFLEIRRCHCGHEIAWHA